MDRRYFEEGAYGKQSALVIERNYRLLLDYARTVISSTNKPHLILDFGCAFGVGTVFLARQFPDAKVIGVDISHYAIKKAISNYKQKNTDYLCLDLVNANDFDSLRKKYDQFDLIITRDTLEHIHPNNHVKILKAFAELLEENNGTILVQTPNKLNLLSYSDTSHIGLRTPNSWMNLFAMFFKKIKILVKQYVPLAWRLKKNKEIWEFPLPLIGYNIYIYARRKNYV